MRHIIKVGLAVIEDGRILFVRKSGAPSWILPGGKPEGTETDHEALGREITEELGCSIVDGSLMEIGSFTAPAADLKDVSVTVRLYKGELEGNPSPQAEIEEMTWFGQDDDNVDLAPSLKLHILPHLETAGLLPARSL